MANSTMVRRESRAVLARVNNINFKTAATTALYTVPAGKRAIVDSVVFVQETMSGLDADADFNIGFTAPDYNDYFSGVSTALSAVDESEKMSLAGAKACLQPAAVLNLKITLGAAHTTDTKTVLVYGTEIPA